MNKWCFKSYNGASNLELAVGVIMLATLACIGHTLVSIVTCGLAVC